MKKLLLILAFLTVTLTSKAQWTQTNGPKGGIINALTSYGTNLFAGTFGGGIYLSTNNGSTWTNVNNGLIGSGLFILSLTKIGIRLFAGTFDGLFDSRNLIYMENKYIINTSTIKPDAI